MGFEVKLWIISIIIMVASSRLEDYSAQGAEVPCYFIFGDSLAENGNNNNLQTTAKANYKPYGIDFPYGPTGRMCNGRTIIDVIAELLGYTGYIPAYESSKFTDALFGINYGSGSGGIRNETGQHLGEVISFDKQLENHRKTMLNLVQLLRSEEGAKQYLGNCLYTVGLGNNDYIQNYFVPDYYNTSQQYTLTQFTQLLIQQYKSQIQRLYSYGARKIAIFSLGSLGCTPYAISTYGDGKSCVEIIEKASIDFNKLLILLVDQFNLDYPDASFTYIDYYGIGKSSSATLGFTNIRSGCCPTTKDGRCIPDGIPCKNRTAYVFWDSIHPSEALTKAIGLRSYQALNPSDAHPFDIKTLIEIENRHHQISTA
ncbi:GDSL-like Lipase/Acylhydrolase superfamily protein [Euphorbia peplus]|nr:GDSL-like Lipase/Acylhydrolase superfamily protein [Euphorbia peplus]